MTSAKKPHRFLCFIFSTFLSQSKFNLRTEISEKTKETIHPKIRTTYFPSYLQFIFPDCVCVFMSASDSHQKLSSHASFQNS